MRPPCGSPPLTRGKERAHRYRASENRITPAYAGKSSTRATKCTNSGDHPRLRGEKAAATYAASSCSGSPPLTRGKVERSSSVLKSLRITPAYAGKRRRPPRCRRCVRDHPRLRGEKGPMQRRGSPGRGSPPLTRGKVFWGLRARGAFGITPAYAGKSFQLCPPAASVWDHPRLRGEKLRLAHACPRGQGSPPLTRGKGWK